MFLEAFLCAVQKSSFLFINRFGADGRWGIAVVLSQLLTSLSAAIAARELSVKQSEKSPADFAIL
jgi:hypothetical protein